jgi:TatD DNase family protein
MRPLLVDSHCHLDRLDLATCGGSVAAALALAREAGVGRVLCIALDPDNIPAVLQLAHDFPEVAATVGVHPLHIPDGSLSAAELRGWAQDQQVVAIGETGLDYFYAQATAAAQRDSFAMHLQVAADVGLPVVVHTRDAREDTLALIKQHGSLEHGGVLHCFTESWEMARQAMDLNFSISISGIVTFGSAAALREVVRKLPLDRMLVETDSPYLAPVPYRGRSNQPAYVSRVAQAVADIKGLPLQQIVEATTSNYDRLFCGAGGTC